MSNSTFEATRLRIDALLSLEIPAMVSRGELTQPQLLETVGVIALWMRAVLGVVQPEIERALNAFLGAIRATYPNDTRPLAVRLHGHVREALHANPALVQLKGHIEVAMSTEADDDPAVRASQAFITYATRPTSDPDVVAYFELLSR